MNDEQITCPSCLALNAAVAVNCRNCGASLSGASALDPLGAIQAEGALWRKSVEGRPKPIALITVWVIFLPVFLVTAAIAVKTILTESGTGGFIFFWFSIAAAVVSFIFLYRVTYNYLTISRKLPEELVEQPKKTKLKLCLK